MINLLVLERLVVSILYRVAPNLENNVGSKEREKIFAIQALFSDQ